MSQPRLTRPATIAPGTTNSQSGSTFSRGYTSPAGQAATPTIVTGVPPVGGRKHRKHRTHRCKHRTHRKHRKHCTRRNRRHRTRRHR
jgi:hypothetical protein